MLKVFNVGQGDSFLLHVEGCKFGNQYPLLIDTGLSKAKVYQKIPDEEIAVLITHAHGDHIGGLPGVIKNKKVQEIIIPKYLPEIIKISQFLDKHIKNAIKSPDWRKIKKLSFRYVCEGSRLCDHITVLNPPCHYSDLLKGNKGSERSIEEALIILKDKGIDLPKDDIVEYRTPLPPNGTNREEKFQQYDDNMAEYPEEARRLVHSFFINLSHSLESISSTAISFEIQRQFDLTSNQASIVFIFSLDNSERWLFTGDADEYVFDRLLSNKVNIAADVLKVPHHGSRENLSYSILKAISPRYAIVSHGNRAFGKSRDCHPHDEVINQLDNLNVQTFYTNDVIKKKKVIKPATVGPVFGGKIDFV